MSIAAETHSGLTSGNPLNIRPSHIYFWCFSVLWATFLAWGFARDGRVVLHDMGALAPWVLVLAVVNLLPVIPSHQANFTPDIPIAIAAMLVLPPLEAGTVALLGTFDPSEFRGRIALSKTLFNRSQISLAVWGGSLAVHALVRSPAPSPFMLPLAFVSLFSMSGVNYLLTGVGVSLEYGISMRHALRHMRVGSVQDFTLTLASWGVLGAMLAALYDQAGLFALGAFLAPTLLGRQALLRSQTSIDSARAYRSQQAALAQMSHQLYEERTDERRLIAADLHDEVLQPLFEVTLMAHVLKADLASGQLLEMDQDLPELLTAAERASSTLRDLIGDLRRSALGRGGLGPAIEALARSISKRSPIVTHTDMQHVAVDPDSELVLYQIAKEALTNAMAHSRAANVWIRLSAEQGVTRLTLKDDGVGFDPLDEPTGHYGLAIMRERAAAIGADLYIDSLPGRGSRVEVFLRTT
jgi:signal transduction histidine kinase